MGIFSKKQSQPATKDRIISMREQVWPFYVLCDESETMGLNGGIEAINLFLPELHAILAGNVIVNDKCRLGIITFSDIALELMPLSKLSEVSSVPGLVSKGAANYGAAFTFMREVISRDVRSLKSEELTVFRPAVFFISGSIPTGDWEKSHQSLVDKNSNLHAPHIISFGAADAERLIIEKIGTKGAHLTGEGIDPYEAVKAMIENLIKWQFLAQVSSASES